MTNESPGKHPYHHGDLRSALLRTARLILEDEGPRALTLREAARRAGVSHAAPRYHFSGLREFMADCAATGFDELADALQEGWQAGGGDPKSGLCTMGRAYVLYALSHRAVFRLMFDHDTYATPTTTLKASGDKAYSVLVRGVEALDPGKEPSQVALGVTTLWSLVHGFATLLLEGKIDGEKPRPDVVGDRVATAVRMFFPGYLDKAGP